MTTENRIALYTGIVLVAVILLVGFINGQDIKACQEAGNSLETCYATLNP